MVLQLATASLEEAEKNGSMGKLEPLQHKLGQPINNSWKTFQHLAALSASLGALAAGTCLSWSLIVIPKILYESTKHYSFDVTHEEINMIFQMYFWGGAIICLPMCFLMNKIGRRTIMLMLIILFIIGWALITWAQNVTMLILGRLVTGMAGGAFCVATPVYTSEIAQDFNRGTLSSYFQLMETIGMIFTCVVGAYTTIFELNIACACIPLLLGIVFFFVPESPSFLVAQGKPDEARRALVLLRGSEYEADLELDKLKRNAENSKNNPESIISTVTKKSTCKSMVICLALSLFQAVSGYSAVLFYLFKYLGVLNIDISFYISEIVLFAIFAMSTLITTVTVDRFGRRILLLTSTLIMCFCFVGLAIVEGLEGSITDHDAGLASVCFSALFFIAFFVGTKPLVWIVACDLCQIDGKYIIVSTSGTFYNLSVLIVSPLYMFLYNHLHKTVLYSLFASTNLLACLFVFFVVPETKGKSNDEIKSLVGGGDRPTKVQLQKL